ncbi:MAG TPA: hypothetical protein VK483_05560 [Chitinophagaceae bacterium]|nr:hypothetical protein [Chitinophagaceae bacterium]
MTKKFIAIILSILPTVLFGQNISDPENKKAVKEDCPHEIVFDKVEILPSLSVPLSAYADSLKMFLQQRNINLKGKKVMFRFIVTSRSQISGLGMHYPALDDKEDLQDAILNFSHLWVPARQNSRVVCSYVNLEISFIKDKPDIRIYQWPYSR